MEPTTSAMTNWLEKQRYSIALAIRRRSDRDRLQSDAERIAELTNDYANAAAEIRQLQQEATWQIK